MFELVADLRTTTSSAQTPWADGNGFLNVILSKLRLQDGVPPRHSTNCEDQRHFRALLIPLRRGGKVAKFDRTTSHREAKPLAAHRQVLLYWVGHNLHQRLVGPRRTDLVPLEKLHAQASKALESTWHSKRRVHLNEHILRRMHVDQHLARLVQGTVEQCHQALVCDVGPDVSDVPATPCANILVVVAIQQFHGPLSWLDTL
mmetsp:Transcript_4750/g.9343  ORF Transcript_4750/g.9343 Transcript_4750/m.9343 type:complete len:202 (+) Transcript_4750:76-681(+)